MDAISELRHDRFHEEQTARYFAREEYCEKCKEHNENCPYYDAEEESWDFETCYKDSE